MSIEALLTPLTRSVLIEAAYFAIQIIRHRFRWLPEPTFIDSPPKLSKESEQIALDIIKIIDQQEGKPLEQLNTERAENYIAMLADIVHQRSVEDLQYDKNRGQKILNELRRSTAS